MKLIQIAIIVNIKYLKTMSLNDLLHYFCFAFVCVCACMRLCFVCAILAVFLRGEWGGLVW